MYVSYRDRSERGELRNIGSKLIEEVIVRSKQLGMKRVELDSGFQREKAHQFYSSKLGFEKRAYLFSYVL